jgi:uncharacterized protein YndB with AHSA1/START domain
MNQRVTFDLFYPHPPDRVWRALTDPTALQRWLMPTDFRPLLGYRFQFRDRGDRRCSVKQRAETVCCEVVALEEQRRLAYTWQSDRDPEPTLVTWTLEPVEGGTRLQLEHTALTSPENPVFGIEAAANWKMALSSDLPTALDRKTERPRSRRIGLILLPNAKETVRCVSRQRLLCELHRL